MMKFSDRETAPELSKQVKQMLEDLLPAIDELKRMEVGLNINTKPSAFDLVLTADFDNEDGLNVYRAHPDHVRILDFMKNTVEKTAVVDYII
jgi:transcriptional regulator CtsR